MAKAIGHKTQRGHLSRLAAEGRLPSALLLAGPEGIGKGIIAEEITASLFCESSKDVACHACKPCTLFFSGNHPDLYQVECGAKDEWPLARYRELLYSLHLKPFMGGARIVIFTDAEQMSVQAANALLKTLEEPPANTWFILVSSNPSKLPVTLLSRCQRWNFDSLSPQEIGEVIEALEGSGGDLSRLLSERPDLVDLLDGSMRNLEVLRAAVDKWDDTQQTLNDIARGEARRINELAQELSKQRDTLRLRLHFIRIHSRQMMWKSRAIEDQVKWSIVLSNMITAEYLIFERNLNASSVIVNALIPLLPEEFLPSFTLLPGGGNLLEEHIV